MIPLKFSNLPRYDKASDVPLITKEDALSLYKQAADVGVPFWQFLEMVQPTKAGESLTAFERQLQRFNIMINSKPEMGLMASTGEYFFQADRPGSAVLFPVLLQKVALWSKLRKFPDISSIVSTTRTISGTSAFSSLFIDDSNLTGPLGDGRRFRVDQRGNFPKVTIGWSDKTNAVTKHGVQLDWTYEFVRRASIELMTTVVSRIMIQDQLEVFESAVDLAINGDASNDACRVMTLCKSTHANPTTNQIVLEVGDDAIAAGVLPYTVWLKFIGGMRPYSPNSVMGNLNSLVKFITMSRPNIDPAAVITSLLEAKSQGTAKLDESALFPNVTLYLAESMPDNKLLAIDTAFAMERVIELGSDIQEVARVITNQTEQMVISIADTVSKLFNDAIRVLDFSGAPQA